MLKNLSLIFMGLFILSACSNSEDEPKVKSDDFQATCSSDWAKPNTLDKLSSCSQSPIELTKNFHEEIVKTVTIKNKSFLIVNSILNNTDSSEKIGFKEASKTSKIKISRDLRFYDHTSKETKVLLKNYYIQDMVNYKDKLYVIHREEDGYRLLLSVYDANGVLEHSQDLLQKRFAKSECKHMPYDGNYCYGDDKSLVEQQIKLKNAKGYVTVGNSDGNGHNFPRLGQIKIDSEGDIIIFTQTLSFMSGNIYRLKDNGSEYTVTSKTQLLPSVGILDHFIGGLNGGHELLAFNRYTKENEKKLSINPDGSGYLAFIVNARYLLEYGQDFDTDSVPGLTEGIKMFNDSSIPYDENLEVLVRSYLAVINFDKYGRVVYKKIVPSSVTPDSTLTDLHIVDNHLYIVLTSNTATTENTSVYVPKIMKINKDSGELVESVDVGTYEEDSASIILGSTVNKEAGAMYLTGRTGFIQNNAGQSITTDGYMSLYKVDLESLTMNAKYFKFSNRKDVGYSLEITPSMNELLIGFAIDGTVTHSADKNIHEGYQKSYIIRHPL